MSTKLSIAAFCWLTSGFSGATTTSEPVFLLCGVGQVPASNSSILGGMYSNERIEKCMQEHAGTESESFAACHPRVTLVVDDEAEYKPESARWRASYSHGRVWISLKGEKNVTVATGELIPIGQAVTLQTGKPFDSNPYALDYGESIGCRLTTAKRFLGN